MSEPTPNMAYRSARAIVLKYLEDRKQPYSIINQIKQILLQVPSSAVNRCDDQRRKTFLSISLRIPMPPPIPIDKCPTIWIETQKISAYIERACGMWRRDSMIGQRRCRRASWRWQVDWPVGAIERRRTHDLTQEGFPAARRFCTKCREFIPWHASLWITFVRAV